MAKIWKALVVGAGGMGSAWAKTINKNPRTKLACWIDTEEGLAERKCEEYSFKGVTTDIQLRSALESQEFEFVVDVTPPEVHSETVIQALEMGLPVLGEKPMSTSLFEAKKMVKASEKAGLLYCVSQNYRFNNQVFGLEALVKKLGRLSILNSDFYIGAHFGGFRDQMDSPLLLDMAIHTFDLARAIGNCDPVSVYAEEFNPVWSWYHGNACAQAMFEMTNDVHFNYRGAWIGHGIHTPWNGRWRVVGEKGSALWNGNEPAHIEIVKGNDGFTREMERIEAPEFHFPEGLDGSLEAFLNALEGGPMPPTECHNNLKSLAMVFGAVESSRFGHRVPIDV